MLKKNTYVVRGLAIIGAIALFVSGMALGAAIDESKIQKQSDNIKSNAEDIEDEANIKTQNVDSIGEISVLPSTSVLWKISYTLCEHETEIYDNSSVVGMTRTEIERAFPKCEIVKFGKDEVEIKRTMEGFCPKHLLLKMENGRLVVYKMDENTLLPYEYKEIKYSETEFANNEELKKGILFNTEKEINEYIENLES